MHRRRVNHLPRRMHHLPSVSMSLAKGKARGRARTIGSVTETPEAKERIEIRTATQVAKANPRTGGRRLRPCLLPLEIEPRLGKTDETLERLAHECPCEILRLVGIHEEAPRTTTGLGIAGIAEEATVRAVTVIAALVAMIETVMAAIAGATIETAGLLVATLIEAAAASQLKGTLPSVAEVARATTMPQRRPLDRARLVRPVDLGP